MAQKNNTAKHARTCRRQGRLRDVSKLNAFVNV